MTPSKTENVPATASSRGGAGDQQIAKSATREQVEKANEEALKARSEAQVAAAEAQLAAAKGEGESERKYVTDEDGISRLAATPGQPVPDWAKQMAEKTGGLSNEPKPGPEATA